MKKNKSKKMTQEIPEDEILSLSLYQLVILFILSIQEFETVRYSLLQDINTYIFPQAKLSPSSFYNTLDRLQKIGLVEMSKSNSGRIKGVKGTPKIKKALEVASKHAAMLSFNPELIFAELLPMFNEHINLGKVKNILFIDLDEFFDIGFTSLLKKYAEEIFILAENESFEKYQNRSDQKLNQTQIYNARIREPDKIFDAVFITDFHIKDDFYGMNEKTLLKEAMRVTKSSGVVIILGTQSLPQTNNIVLDSIVKNFQNNPFMVSITEESFEEIILSASPSLSKIFNNRGFLMAKIEMQ